MSPEQALALLDQVCSQVQASRVVHGQVQEAIKVLAEALKKPKA